MRVGAVKWFLMPISGGGSRWPLSRMFYILLMSQIVNNQLWRKSWTSGWGGFIPNDGTAQRAVAKEDGKCRQVHS